MNRETVEAMEISLLGACAIGSREVMDDVAAIVRPDDFIDEKRRNIYTAMLVMNAEGRGIDVTTLFRELSVDGVSAEELSSLMGATPTSHHAVDYAMGVAANSRLRMLANKCVLIAKQAVQDGADDSELIANAIREITSIQERIPYESVYSVSEFVPGLAMKIINECGTGYVEKRLDTGLESLDMQLDGMRGGDLVIVAARPSVGKSAFMLQLSLSACKQNRPVLFFSLEMGKDQLAERVLASIGSLPLRGIRRRDLMPMQCEKLYDAANVMRQHSMTIDDSAGQRLSEIRAKARKWSKLHKDGVVVIDYLGIITPDQREQRRDLEVAAMTKALKGLARELGVPVIVASQLGRSAENESDEFRKLSQLRESGSIEQDADIVMILSRLSKGQEKAVSDQGRNPDEVVSLTVAKNRNGATCRLLIAYDKSTQTFSDERKPMPQVKKVYTPNWDKEDDDDRPF